MPLVDGAKFEPSHLSTESLLMTTKLCCHQLNSASHSQKTRKEGVRVKGLQVPSLQINSVLWSRLFQQEVTSHSLRATPRLLSSRVETSWCYTPAPGAAAAEFKPAHWEKQNLLTWLCSPVVTLKTSIRLSSRYCSWHVS